MEFYACNLCVLHTYVLDLFVRFVMYIQIWIQKAKWNKICTTNCHETVLKENEYFKDVILKCKIYFANKIWNFWDDKDCYILYVCSKTTYNIYIFTMYVCKFAQIECKF